MISEEMEGIVDELASSDASEDQVLLAGWVAASVAGEDVPVESMVLSGTTTVLSDLRLDPEVSSVVIRSEGASLEEEQEAPVEPVICSYNQGVWSAPRPWGPYRGYVRAGQTLTGRRYIYQEMRWPSSDLKRMQCETLTYSPGETVPWARTYEADAHFYRSGGFYLADKRVWSTNLPKKRYLDSRLLENTTRSWTVGTRRMRSMKPGYIYWTRITTMPGEAARDTGIIYGQIGRPVLLNECPWNFCVYGLGSSIIFSSYRAPGRTDWCRSDVCGGGD